MALTTEDLLEQILLKLTEIEKNMAICAEAAQKFLDAKAVPADKEDQPSQNTAKPQFE